MIDITESDTKFYFIIPKCFDNIIIEKCKEILKKYNYNLSNEEIKQVREVLYLFAEIQINAEKQLLEDEKCDIILQS